MKIQIEETIYQGTGTEIMDQLRGEIFEVPTEVPDTESYIRFLQGNAIRMAGRECPLPEKDTEARAVAMLRHLEQLGALIMLEAA